MFSVNLPLVSIFKFYEHHLGHDHTGWSNQKIQKLNISAIYSAIIIICFYIYLHTSLDIDTLSNLYLIVLCFELSFLYPYNFEIKNILIKAWIQFNKISQKFSVFECVSTLCKTRKEEGWSPVQERKRLFVILYFFCKNRNTVPFLMFADQLFYLCALSQIEKEN